MTWKKSYWTKSGIVESFRFVMCQPTGLFAEEKELTGVQSATINLSYTGSSKYGGQLEVINSNWECNHVIRIYYTAELPSTGDSTTILLGTFFSGTSDQTYEKGEYSGTIDLWGTLFRYTETKLNKNMTCAKGSKIVSWFWKLMKMEGSTGKIASNIKTSAKFSKTVVYDFGKTKWDMLSNIASRLNARVELDAKGQIWLKKKVAHSKRTPTYTVPTGAASVTFEGVEYSNTEADVVNRYYTKAEMSYQVEEKYKDKKGKTKKKKVTKTNTYYGSAQLSKSSVYHFSKRGRNVDSSESYSDLPSSIEKMKDESSAQRKKKGKAIQKWLKEEAQDALASVDSASYEFKFDSLYMPYTIGDMIWFEYIDSADDSGIKIKGLVESIDYKINERGLTMSTTIKSYQRARL